MTTPDSYNGNIYIKRDGVQQSFTAHEVNEYRRCMADVGYFAEKYVKVISLDHGLVPFKLRGYQEKMVKHFSDNRFTIILACRQSGKCSVGETEITIKFLDGPPLRAKISLVHEIFYALSTLQKSLFYKYKHDLPKEQVFNEFKPESMSSIEVGYKGVIAEKLMVDANVYYNAYKNFINQQTVFAKEGRTDVPTGAFAAGAAFRPYFNTSFDVSSVGAGLGLTYRLPKGYNLSGNYSYASFAAKKAPSTYEMQFNTPQNKFNLNVANRNVWKNIGFDLAYRWQEGFLWQSAFGVGDVPAFGVCDAQINYKAKEAKLMFKVGASNLFGKDYITNYGGPWVGKLYYISVSFDEFLR
jgi:hypothetical protein